MRKSWRSFFMIALIGLWPQIGCHQLPSGKSVQDLRPIQPNDMAVAKKGLSAEEVGQSLVVQAKAAEDARKTNEAVSMYERIRSTDPAQGVHATKKIALLHLRSNDLDRAEQEYQLLWQNNPRDADTLCALGDIAYRRGHFGTAEKRFQDALSRQPDHPHAMISLAMTLAQKGNKDGSVELFRKAGLGEGEALCEVAFVMKLNNKQEDAMRTYQTALSKDPGLQRARNEIAQMYQADPGLAVRLTTPFRSEKRGIVDLEPSAPLASEGTGRLMLQRPTLPPLPDFDLAETNGRDWQTSGKKK